VSHPSRPSAPEFRAHVLGVAQDGGLPHAGCACARCDAARRGKRRRERVACLGVTDGKRAWLLDATPDLPDQLHDLGVRSPQGVFLTHAHMGHYLGLAHLGREALGVRGVALHGTPRMRDFLRTNAPWSALFDQGRVTFDASLHADLGGVTAEAIPVPHRGEWTDTVGWILRGPRASVLWLPDIDSWDAWDRDVREVVASVDVAFLDATFYDDGELPGVRMDEVPHPRVVDTMRRLGGLADRVRLVHLNHTNPLWDDEAPATAHGFRVARDGDVIDL